MEILCNEANNGVVLLDSEDNKNQDKLIKFNRN